MRTVLLVIHRKQHEWIYVFVCLHLLDADHMKIIIGLDIRMFLENDTKKVRYKFWVCTFVLLNFDTLSKVCTDDQKLIWKTNKHEKQNKSCVLDIFYLCFLRPFDILTCLHKKTLNIKAVFFVGCNNWWLYISG